MAVLALGLNHGSAPLDVRGRFAFPADALGQALRGLGARLQRAPAEAAILSTCNRTELYIATPDGAPAVLPTLLDWLAEHGGMPAAALQSHTYVRQDCDAARHAFRVAAGLDSMVLGEPQILGQLKLAVKQAEEAGALRSTLHQLFQRSFSVAKEVRSCTDIGVHSVSMAAAAVRLAEQLFEQMADTRVLCVGAGEMIGRVATHFAARKPRALVLANRTPARGEALAQALGAQSMPLAELPARLGEFDVVVSCTASTLPLIGLGAVERALKARRRRPMLLLDLAVPRDIEAEVARLPEVYLYTVDDLATRVRGAGERRQAAVAQAEGIIDAGVERFGRWLAQRGAVPLIRSLNEQVDSWRAAEIARARKRLAAGMPIDEVFEALSQGLAHKLMHGTLAELHAAGGAALAPTVQRLFLRR
ncbi:MAG: glutamyl-tRNA reductase [Aquincola tertiaricarbonis]